MSRKTRMRAVLGWSWWRRVVAMLLAFGCVGLTVRAADAPLTAPEAARRIDEALRVVTETSSPLPEARARDEAFLRRLSFDLTGQPPSPDALTAFVLDPASGKRARAVEALAASRSAALHWARYWRDALFSRAQDRRAQSLRPAFTAWLAEGFAADRSWHELVTEMLTAHGPIRGQGRAALVVAHTDPKELAAETSRLFLGIQIQCAQCHDHPYDEWKREQFHELAAFFPRVRVRRAGKTKPPTFEIASVEPDQGKGGRQRPARLLRRLDKDGDGKVAFTEVPERLQKRLGRPLASVDANGDGVLNVRELQAIVEIGRTREIEHFMRDLEDPGAPGSLTHPAFFVTGDTPGQGRGDLDRRGALARYLDAPDNPWLARAFVNRVWMQMLGWGFVEPVDDMGPGRDARHPELLDLLAEGLRRNGYRLGWLVRSIALSDSYGRALKPLPSALDTGPTAPCPRRLAADELFASVARALGLRTGQRMPGGTEAAGGRSPGSKRRGGQRLRAEFTELFGADPSTPPEDVKGTLAQALFLMNSEAIEAALRAGGRTPLARLLEEQTDNRVILDELYLRVLSRFPTAGEAQTCLRHLQSLDSREEGFEDIFWCLLNSTEFQLRS